MHCFARRPLMLLRQPCDRLPVRLRQAPPCLPESYCAQLQPWGGLGVRKVSRASCGAPLSKSCLWSFLFVCLSVPPGVVPEPPDEGQEAALSHDVASPRRPGFLHLHDEPRGGHGQPALSLPVPPAASLLLPHGDRSSHVGFSRRRRRPFQLCPATAGHLSRPLPPPVPQARTAVRLPTPVPLRRAGARTEQRRRRGRRQQPLLLLGLSREPVERAASEAFGTGLYLLGHYQDGLFPHLHAVGTEQGLLGLPGSAGRSPFDQIRG